MLFLKLVDRGPGIRVAPRPELLDESVLLFRGLELLVDLDLLRRDDGGDVLLQPLPVMVRVLGGGPFPAALAQTIGAQDCCEQAEQSCATACNRHHLGNSMGNRLLSSGLGFMFFAPPYSHEIGSTLRRPGVTSLPSASLKC